jgi:hypothetical protein
MSSVHFFRWDAGSASSTLSLLAAALALGQNDKNQPPGKPGGDALESLYKRFLNDEFWYGSVRIAIGGSGHHGSSLNRECYSIGREGEVKFRLRVHRG